MSTIALKMLLMKRLRFCVTILGLAFLFFLSASQIGLLVGWCNTTSAVIRHAGVDLWVVGKGTTALEYGVPIPESRVHQVRSVPGVAWAEGMLMDWTYWRNAEGKRQNCELVGLDDSRTGGPWHMADGRIEDVAIEGGVVVDELFAGLLGFECVGDYAEIAGERAEVRGISRDVRTFTAAPFIFTSIENARRFDPFYEPDTITYVLVRCSPGDSIAAVREDIASAIPSSEVLTTGEFATRTVAFWMIETGVGITVVLTAILGFGVSALVTAQSLFALTQEYLPNYATLLALGFSRAKLTAIVALQSLLLGSLGTSLGSALFFYGVSASARTPIPLETTPEVFLGLAGTNLLVCLLSSTLGARSVLKVDPVSVFGA